MKGRRSSLGPALITGLLLAELGCAELESAEAFDAADALAIRGPIVALDGFELVELADDPLADHRPELIDCPEAAWGMEDGSLEVQTGVCNYLALSQVTRRPISSRGTPSLIDLWHDSLDAAEPALGHFAVLLAGEVVAEYEVEIPSDAAAQRLRWTADAPVPAGAELGLHLHNHGFNAWTIVNVELDPRP